MRKVEQEYYFIDYLYNKMFNVIEFLKGKKSYIVGILMIVLGLIQDDSKLILEGIAIMTLRAGISKV